MATPLKQIPLNELTPTIVALSDAGGKTEHTDWIRARGNAALVIQFIDQQRGLCAPLPADHYYVHVNRGPFPSMTILQNQFSEGGVSEIFFNSKYKWERHSSRSDADDVTANDVVMVAKRFTDKEIKEIGGLESEKIIAWGLKNDLLPADEKETYAFGINIETRDLQREFWLVGLGSSTLHGAGRCVALLRSGSDRRILGSDWFDGVWHSDDRFLFVRKDVV